MQKAPSSCYQIAIICYLVTHIKFTYKNTKKAKKCIYLMIALSDECLSTLRRNYRWLTTGLLLSSTEQTAFISSRASDTAAMNTLVEVRGLECFDSIPNLMTSGPARSILVISNSGPASRDETRTVDPVSILECSSEPVKFKVSLRRHYALMGGLTQYHGTDAQRSARSCSVSTVDCARRARLRAVGRARHPKRA